MRNIQQKMVGLLISICTNNSYDSCPLKVLEGQKFEFKTIEEIEKIKNKNPQSEVLIKKSLGI